VVDWLFTKRLECFLKHWLYDTLNAEWHWYRYEFQARGIHCHGTAKLKNDPSLCNQTEIALKCFLAEKWPNDCKDVNILLDIQQGKRVLSKFVIMYNCKLVIFLMFDSTHEKSIAMAQNNEDSKVDQCHTM
jgi:hypothetical protein